MPSAKTDLKSLLKDPSLLETRAYVNGKWIDGDDGTFDVTNPARGDVIAQVADLSRAQVGQAIDAAEAAQKDWASWTGKERAAVLRKWFDLMMENQDDLGTILTAEQGKPLAEAGAGKEMEKWGTRRWMTVARRRPQLPEWIPAGQGAERSRRGGGVIGKRRRR